MYLKICPLGRGIRLWHQPCLSFPCSHGLWPLLGPGTPLERGCCGGLGVPTLLGEQVGVQELGGLWEGALSRGGSRVGQPSCKH